MFNAKGVGGRGTVAVANPVMGVTSALDVTEGERSARGPDLYYRLAHIVVQVPAHPSPLPREDVA